DRCNDPANKLIEYFAAPGAVDPSTGAVTFGRNLRITNTAFAPVFGLDPVVNTTYMGDYDVAIADNANFYYVWGDERLGSADVRPAWVSVTQDGPQIGRRAPHGPNSSALNAIDQFFDQPMDMSTFTLTHVLSFPGPAG